MTPTHHSTTSSRELLALTTFLSIGSVAAQAAPPTEKNKKESSTNAEGETLAEVQVSATRQAAYNVQQLQNTKFTAPVLDTPKTITVIPQELMKERGATSLTDILRSVPGISLGAGEGGTPVGDRPFIRGYEASTDIMIDGMRDLARFSHETFNVEQVEVVKGPGSAYSGRGSTGGSINLASKTAKAENFTELSLGGGTDNYFRAAADTNYALTDTVAFRLNAMFHDADTPGRDWVESSRWGIAPTVTFGVGTATRATLSYYHLRTDEVPDLGHPFGPRKPVDVDRDNYYGVLDRDFRDTEANIGTFRLEHDLNDSITISNTLRVLETDNDYIMTRPTLWANDPTQVTRDFRASRRHSDAIINQTDIKAEFNTGAIKHDVVGGLEYSEEKIRAGSYANIAVPRADLNDPNPHVPGGQRVETAYGDPTTTESYSAYLFDTVTFNEKWILNLGLRYDHYDVDNGTISRQDDLFNYQIGLVYKPLPNGSIYASYGTSSNPAGETAGQSGGADGAAGGGINEDLKPEESYSVEVGTKWNFFNDQLQVSAALFQTEKTDARSQDAATGLVTLNGNTRVRGIELSAGGNITEDWHLWAGYTYMDPEILEYRSGGVDFDGNQLKFVSKHSLSIWSSYDVTDKFTAGGGITYMGERFMNDANTLSVDSYYRVDAMLSYEVTKNLNLRLNLNNLTDETIYDASHVGLFAVVAPGRSATLTATYKF
jgi:catecholate siderophore receptor